MPGSDALPSPPYFIWRRILSHTFSAFQRGKGSSTGNSALGLNSEHGTSRLASDAAHLAGRDVRERRLAKFRQNVARFRLYRLRFLQENMRFAAFCKIYQIIKLKILKFGKFG